MAGQPQSKDQIDQTLQSLYNFYNNKSEIPLDWDYLNSQLGVGQPPGTPDLSVPLSKIAVQLDLDKARLDIQVSTEYGAAAFIIYYGPFQQTGYENPPAGEPTWRVYVGYSCAKQISLGQIPLAGNALDPATFSINTVQVLINTAALTPQECTALYTHLNGGSPPTATMSATNYLMAAAPELGGLKTPSARVRVGFTIMGTPELLELAYEPSGASMLPNCSLTPRRLSIGPVRVSRISLEVDFSPGAGVALLVQIALQITVEREPLELVLQGAGINLSFPKNGRESTAVTVAGELKGVEVAAQAGPALEISGGMYVNHIDPPDMWGELMVKGETWGFTLIAAYTKDGSESCFFGFGFLKIPMVGMEPFQLQGLAAGLGINRGLVIPPVNQLRKFPFIQAAMSFMQPTAFQNPFPSNIDSPQALLKTLQTLGTQTAPAKPGTNWLAFGAAISLANMVYRGFLLGTYEFRGGSEVSVCGEMQMILPPAPFGVKNDAVAFLDQSLEIVVDTTGGEIGVDTFINFNSYIADPDVHVTGGTAMRIWYKGKYQGQWLFTMGGYAPSLDLSKYPNYPTVPRLAMQLSKGNLQVQAKAYFAITQSSIMAGLAINASYAVLGVKLWLTASADFVLKFHPLDVGALVSVEAGITLRIKVWFVHISVTFHVGVMAHLGWTHGQGFWLYGRADFAVVSVSFHAGNPAAIPPPLSWEQFEQNYLAPVPDNADAIGDDQSYAVVGIQVQSNVQQSLKRASASDVAWVVDPETLSIMMSSAIPSKAWSATINTTVFGGTAGDTDYGVVPCQIAASALETTLEATLSGPANANSFTITPQGGTMSPGLWGDPGAAQPDPAQVLQDTVCSLRIQPVHPDPDRTLPASAAALLTDTVQLQLPRQSAYTPVVTNFLENSVQGSIASQGAEANRTMLFGAFAELLPAADVPQMSIGDVDVSGFASHDDADLFIDSPFLCLLGENQPETA